MQPTGFQPTGFQPDGVAGSESGLALFASPSVRWYATGGVYRQSWQTRVDYSLRLHVPPDVQTVFSLTADSSQLTLTGGSAALDVTLSATSSQLTLSGGTAYGNVSLAATGSALALVGGTAGFIVALGASGGALVLTGGNATFLTGGDFSLDGTGGTLTLAGGTATFSITDGAEEPQQTPAGRGRRSRRKYVVEIDGQEFVTESLEHAQALLDRAKALAEKQAQERAQEVVAKAIAKARRVGKAEVRVKAPVIEAPEELQPQVDAIRQLYRDAALAAEIQVWLAIEAERDDEEVLLLSL